MKKFICLFLFTSLFGSCNLDFPPENTLTDEIVYKDETTSQGALLGAYVRLCSFLSGAPNDQNNYANEGDAFLFAEMGTGNLTVRSSDATSFSSIDNANYTTSDHDGFIYNLWLGGYNAIDYANNIISGITKYASYSEVKKNQFIAQAKFIRAYAHFELLCLFGDGALTGNSEGLGIIIQTMPYEGYNESRIQSRSSVADCYSQIVKDLTEAIEQAGSNTYSVDSRYLADVNAMKALLARVYLYRGTYKNDKEDIMAAKKYAKQVIDCGNYSFSTRSDCYREELFPNNMINNSYYPNPTIHSNEVIFFEPSRNSLNEFACGITGYFEKKFYYVSPDFINAYPENDVRGYVEGESNCLIGVGSSASYPSDMTTLKYDNRAGYSDVIYIRLAEMKLIYAEAISREQGAITEEALTELNDIYLRAFKEGNKPQALKASDFLNVDELIERILIEKNRELAFEGHARWDFVRCAKPLTNNIPLNRVMLPIPNYEVQISKGVIKQNPGFIQ